MDRISRAGTSITSTALPQTPTGSTPRQSRGWFGQVIQRSDDGGKTWNPVGNEFQYEGATNTHKWYDNSDHPYEFLRVWHLEPSLTDPDTVYAGVEDAALFKSTDGGHVVGGAVRPAHHPTAPTWAPGAGGLCLHTIILDPTNNRPHHHRHLVRRSVPERRQRQDLEADQPGLEVDRTSRTPTPRSATASTTSRCTRAAPTRCSCRSTGTCMRSDDAGDSWHEVSGNLPTDFGFAIDVHAHEPETIYVVPITSDSDHFVPDGKLRVYRSRSGGNEWEALTKGLPQKDCYVNVLRDAMAVDSLESCGVYFGTTGGQVYASADSGDSWTPIVERPACCALGRGADAGVIRVELPANLRTLADVGREVELRGRRAGHAAHGARCPRGRPTRCCAGRSATTSRKKRRPMLRFFACEEDLSDESSDAPLPEAVAAGKEPYLIVGAIAGG